jgi:hypothetical protein
MHMIDAHYTPPLIARELLSHAGELPQGLIADFAAGGGELLLQAAKRWQTREILACDISHSAVARLSKQWPDWKVGRCDFYSARSRGTSRLLRFAKGDVALCVANPPFSYRGGKQWQVTSSTGTPIRCGPAMAFLLIAVEYLRPGGQLVSIIPANALRSSKDEAAIDLMHQLGSLRLLDSYPRGTFPNCTSRTVSIAFRRQATSARNEKLGTEQGGNVKVEVELTRGTTPMHCVTPLRKGSVPVVHTSELQNNSVQSPTYGVPRAQKVVTGPAVLVPRVGKPQSGKIALYTKDEPIVLSDCVFAIRCASGSDSLYVLNLLLSNWDHLSSAYHGTCAPYITINDLIVTLSEVGIRVCTNTLAQPPVPTEASFLSRRREG